MRKFKSALILSIMLAFVVSCASEAPWRKATVTTFELAGIGIEATKDTTEILKSNNVISDVQVAKIKELYNKAKLSYAKAGEALKLAGRVASSSEKETLLSDYTRYLAEFSSLSIQIYDMIKNFKKVSHYEIMESIINGKEVTL